VRGGFGCSELISVTHFQNKISAVRFEHFIAAEVYEVFSGNEPCQFVKMTEVSGTISVSIIRIKMW
jgi:hypothetical protein